MTCPLLDAPRLEPRFLHDGLCRLLREVRLQPVRDLPQGGDDVAERVVGRRLDPNLNAVGRPPGPAIDRRSWPRPAFALAYSPALAAGRLGSPLPNGPRHIVPSHLPRLNPGDDGPPLGFVTDPGHL